MARAGSSMCAKAPTFGSASMASCARTKIHAWQVDGFAMRPDEDNPGFFDNAPDPSVGFWGAYATRSMPEKTALDLYYLGQDRKEATFERGTAHEVRHRSAGEYRGLSPANIPAGISTMKHFGSSAASERQTSAPGPSQRRRAIGFPRFR